MQVRVLIITGRLVGDDAAGGGGGSGGGGGGGGGGASEGKGEGGAAGGGPGGWRDGAASKGMRFAAGFSPEMECPECPCVGLILAARLDRLSPVCQMVLKVGGAMWWDAVLCCANWCDVTWCDVMVCDGVMWCDGVCSQVGAMIGQSFKLAVLKEAFPLEHLLARLTETCVLLEEEGFLRMQPVAATSVGGTVESDVEFSFTSPFMRDTVPRVRMRV